MGCTFSPDPRSRTSSAFVRVNCVWNCTLFFYAYVSCFYGDYPLRRLKWGAGKCTQHTAVISRGMTDCFSRLRVAAQLLQLKSNVTQEKLKHRVGSARGVTEAKRRCSWPSVLCNDGGTEHFCALVLRRWQLPYREPKTGLAMSQQLYNFTQHYIYQHARTSYVTVNVSVII